jgi:hypothetical protein
MTDHTMDKGQQDIVFSVIICPVVLLQLHCLSLFFLLSFSHCIVCHCFSCCPLTMTDNTMAKGQQEKQ